VGAVSTLPVGVYIAMNGRIFNPFKCRKNRDKRMFEEF
jgi:L-asparaginase